MQDDLLKFCILDPHMGFPTRKIHPFNNFTTETMSAVEKIMMNAKALNKKQLSRLKKN